LINVLKRKYCVVAEADATYIVLFTTGKASSVRRALALQLSSAKFLHGAPVRACNCGCDLV